MQQINVKEKPAVGIDGRHLLSICDIRHAGAKKVETDMVRFAAMAERPIQELFAKKHLALSESHKSRAERAREYWRSVAKGISEEIAGLKNAKHAGMAELYQLLRELSLVRQYDIHNIIPTAGRSVIARWIIGDNTYDADDGANYGSLGTSATAPSNSDTQLGTETYRKARSSEARSSNIATLSNFYTATEVTGTFEEAGWHIDGTGSANTGQLLSRFLLSALAKSNQETLVVESVLTIT